MIVRLIGWHFKQFQYYTKNEEENITETNKRKQKKKETNKAKI